VKTDETVSYSQGARHPGQEVKERGIRGRKSLGQSFLVDETAVQRIVDAAELCPDDTVLEIGPGPGTLTVHLAERAGRVVAVELDERMLPALREALGGRSNVEIVHGDILEQDVSSLVGDAAYKVVANVILRHILGARVRPSLMVITVQREVAERIVGRSPGRRGGRRDRVRMSLLATSVQLYGNPRIVARIPAGAFRPIPAVDSAVLRVDVYARLPWGAVDETAFFAVARAGFAQSRKQLRNALAAGLGLNADEVVIRMAAAGIDPSRRAETLSVKEWVSLSRAFGECLSPPQIQQSQDVR